MSTINEFVQLEKTTKVEKSRTKKLEEDNADIRQKLDLLAKFVYHRLQTPDYKGPDTTYDSQVYQLFTQRLESFEGVHFCVEPDVGLGFAQIFIDSDDQDNLDFQRDENIILYSVNGIVIYKQPIAFAMDVIAKAKMEKKEDEAVILGLLDTWFDDSDDEGENEDEEEEKEEEENYLKIKDNHCDDDIVLAFGFLCILLVAIIIMLLVLISR